MNEEKPNINPAPSVPPPQNPTPAPQPSSNNMQDVVQQMLPDDLKKNFVLQKNTPGMEPTSPNTGQPATSTDANKSTLAQLDPKFVQKPIRTYESDLAEALASKQGSVASIAIAESRKREEESRRQELARKAQTQGQGTPQQQMPPVQQQAPTPPRPPINRTSAIPTSMTAPDVPPAPVPLIKKNPPIAQQQVPPAYMPPKAPQGAPAMMTPPNDAVPTRHFPIKKVFMGLASLVLIGGGLSLGYYFYTNNKPASAPIATPEPIVIPSLIPTDKQISLFVGEKEGDALITALYSELNKSVVAPRGNLEILLYEGEAGTPGNRVTGSSFIKKINANMPSIIDRSLTDRWMFGTYTEETGQKSSFLALTTDFFQNAFAGMLMWEQDAIADDLALLLNFKDRARKEELNASSSISAYFTIQGDFTDKVIRNRDVREFRKPDGELLFLYSFINRETLLITTTESAFIALIDRIEKDIYVR